MCVPLIPLALAAAGTFASYIGQKQAERARNTTFSSERQRQADLGDEQHSRFKDSLAKTQDLVDPATRDKAVQAREGSLASAIVPQSASSYLPGSSSAPSVVATANERAGASSQATSLNLARTLATLGATGDQLQDVNTQIGRNSQHIGQLGSFKAGSLGVLDAEMRAASQKGSFLRGIGGLAQQIGGAWLGASAMGAGSAGGAAASKGVDVTYLQSLV